MTGGFQDNYNLVRMAGNGNEPRWGLFLEVLLREIPLSESSVERIANAWLARSLLELPLDEDLCAARRYLQLDVTAVRTAFAKWHRPGDLVQVTQGPNPK